MPVPKLLPTTATEETFGGVTYHLEGELVPVLQIELSQVPVFFEHHVMLWKDPAVGVGIKPLAGAFKRAMSGMSIFMTQTQGEGRIAFSRDGAGHVFGMHLAQGQAIDVREHQFLAAGEQRDIEPGGWIYKDTTVQMQTITQRLAAGLLASSGNFFINRFTGPGRVGIQSMSLLLPSSGK